MIYSLLWLIRATTTTPQEWDIGLGCPLPKYNKPSCLGLRLIHLLDDIGKCWHAVMWRYASPKFAQHSYGFIKGLRRQDAILQTQIAAWLANAMGE
eukprot:2658588-Heterocapsa_arctica.AAC.1